MKEKVEALLKDVLDELNLFVSDAYYSEEEGVKALNIELDSDDIIDVERITEATKVINPIMDQEELTKDIDVLDIHSKEKGENNE